MMASMRQNAPAPCIAAICLGLGAAPAPAQDLSFGLNTYGVPGVIEMPAAGSLDPDDLAYSLVVFRNIIRHAASFQVNDRLTFGMRYNLFYRPGADGAPFAEEGNYDRSFGLHYRLIDEGRILPAVVVGINDILGNGRFESEYLVATRTFGDRVAVSLGLGWGRLAGVGGFDNPLAGVLPGLADRAPVGSGTVGEFTELDWFHGDAALFGGISWQATDRLRLALEYASDAYPFEAGIAFDRQSPVNAGLTYALSDQASLGAYWLYGSELGVHVTYALNPTAPRNPSGLEPAAPLVRPAAAGSAPAETVRARTAAALAEQGIGLHGLALSGPAARVEIENRDWRLAAQALGRTARVLTATLPAGIAQFDIVIVEDGMPVSQSTIRRADLETYEFAHDGAWDMQIRTVRADAGPGTAPLDGLYPRFSWGIDPFLTPSFFDPDSPLRVGAGFDLGAAWEPAPGLVLSGLLRQTLLGNLDDSTRASTSVLPHVRSDAWLYDKADTALSRLTAAWSFRPGAQLYGRVAAGLLEPMYGGVAAEMLWYPADSRLAFGAEIARVVQRDHDQMFGFRDYAVTTGHLSTYWDIGNGYQAQLDAGRYLAGDWGATMTLRRDFENGWSLGVFATLTDVPFDDFGEGSFDKGVLISVPIDWISGQPTRDAAALTLRPVLRDGGARLDVDGRLHETVTGATAGALADGWGRFWR